jgi:hypothetical protein
MSAQYYASFVIHQPGHEAVTQYCGVVELEAHPRICLGARELTRMLASNLDVDCEDVEVLQWGPIH